MEQKVNPNQVEGLADSLGRLNRMIEDQVTGMCKDVSRVVGDTRTQYSEDYVGRAADEVERLIQEIQQLALAIDDKLRLKEKTLRWAAGEYVEREKEAIRKIEEMQQKKIPLVLSREALLQEKNQALSPFGALPVYPFVLTASVSLPVYIPPLSEELSLNPKKYSEEVLRLQQRLKELGYEVEANGYFDEETLKAVNQFKDNYGLENRRSAAGVVDDQMWRYLFGNLNGILTKDSGVYSDPVKIVQSRLKKLGFDIEATGYYDEQTQRAIDGFREIYGKDLSGADGVIGEQTWNALFNIEVPQPQYTIGAYDPYNSVDVNDILNRDDPEVQKRLEQTYWATLSKEEQDRRYREIKEEMDAIDKKWADKMRRAQSGIGNQFFANLITGTSNAVVNTINTASAGLPELITEWIMGPMPEGYVDPLDDPYGKKAGVIAGNMVGFFLPFKYLKGIKTPALLTKLSPTVLRSVTAEAIFSGVTEVSDSVTDFRKDGDQSLGERLFNIAFNSSAAGVGDVAFTYAFKTISGMLKSSGAQKIFEYIRPKKLEAIETPSGKDWEAYFKDKYGEGNVTWETKWTGEVTAKVISEVDRAKLSSWKYPPSDELYLEYKEVFDNPRYYNQATGDINWPGTKGDPNIDGFVNGEFKIETLQSGTIIDRYGSNASGQYFSPAGSSYGSRALPPHMKLQPYTKYIIVKPFQVRSGKIAPWFDEVGEGIQYYSQIEIVDDYGTSVKATVQNLLDLGYIKIFIE
ncbi:glycohydrolase toxin TNT-related protein [Paenibacillus motobuensis]|uniref:glycohydrolase toxin TNT-related protein n=1 Tax=Paenibacillus TaxID=44249 RepID=UPI0020400804|nr:MULTISPECIES: glycohydrolase toxin TNT-related protein [Paenibacillus]MCM3042811.1 glycohydrolase toxin TNT-related protein [Paenibacillus lutimineralis]MCM3649915.1 glycohydrolase toxin TNT-related protein [Paenibacillus motobuensis]